MELLQQNKEEEMKNVNVQRLEVKQGKDYAEVVFFGD